MNTGGSRSSELQHADSVHVHLDEGAPRLASVLQHVPDAVLMLDVQGKIVSWNDAAERLFGYSNAEIKGRHVSCMVPDALITEQKILLRRVFSGESLRDHETQRRTKTGRLVDVALSVGPCRDQTGRLIGVCAVLRDITEQKQQEETLRLSERRYRALVETLPDLLFRIRPDGTLLDFNPASSGQPAPYVPPEEFLGKKITEVLPLEVAEPLHEVIHRCVATQSMQIHEYELPEHPGEGAEARVYECRLMPCGCDEVVAYVRDITERTKTEALRSGFVERLTHANDAERRRIAGELHDQTGQVFASTIFKLQAIQDAEPSGSQRARLAEIRGDIESGVSELRRLARGLHPSLLEDLGFGAAVERLVSDFAGASGITIDLETRGMDGGSELPGDIAIALYRVIQEALTNAAKHSSAAHVSVVIQRRPSSIHVIIEDDGCGFSEEKPQRDAQPTEGARGLGLSGIRERIALLNGTASIEPLLGHGVTVYADVPIRAEAPRGQRR